MRSMTALDHQEVGRLAARTPTFTVPSRYVIWMLSSTQDGLCLVASRDEVDVVGYLLAIHTATVSEIFVWQLGVAEGSLTGATAARELLTRFRELLLERRISVARFTAAPGDAALGLCGLIREIFGVTPELETSATCSSAEGEHEYVVHLGEAGR